MFQKMKNSQIDNFSKNEKSKMDSGFKNQKMGFSHLQKPAFENQCLNV